jgi:hypothetical protein
MKGERRKQRRPGRHAPPRAFDSVSFQPTVLIGADHYGSNAFSTFV